MATDVRTVDETPINMKDIARFKRLFSEVKYSCFWFFTLMIFVKFYLIDRVHPNQERYWKKIILEAKHLSGLYSFLSIADKALLKCFPFMNRYCWNIAVICRK